MSREEVLQALVDEFSKSLGARVKVENELWQTAAGVLPMPDATKLREWAKRLGVPEETRVKFMKEATE